MLFEVQNEIMCGAMLTHVVAYDLIACGSCCCWWRWLTYSAAKNHVTGTSYLELLAYCWFQIIGDVTKEDTLDPKLFKGVKKVVNAVSVIVGPKEGDTPDRQKYKQVCHMPNDV